jgi:hypothetical protein
LVNSPKVLNNMAFISKEDVYKAISGAPPGMSPEEVLDGLTKAGHQLEGYAPSNPITSGAYGDAGGIEQELPAETVGNLGKAAVVEAGKESGMVKGTPHTPLQLGAKLISPITKLTAPQNSLGAMLLPLGVSEGPINELTAPLESTGRGISKVLMQGAGLPTTRAELASKNLGEWLGNSVNPKEVLSNLNSKYSEFAQRLGIKPFEESVGAMSGAGEFAGASGDLTKAVNDYTGPTAVDILKRGIKSSYQELHDVVEAGSRRLDNPQFYSNVQDMRMVPAEVTKSLFALKQKALDLIRQKASSETAQFGDLAAGLGLDAKQEAAEGLNKLQGLSNILSTTTESSKNILKGLLTDYSSGIEGKAAESTAKIAGNRSILNEAFPAYKEALSKGTAMGKSEAIAGLGSEELSGAAEGTKEAANGLQGLRKQMAIAHTAETTNSLLPKNLNGSLNMLRYALGMALPSPQMALMSPLMAKLGIGATRGAYLAAKNAPVLFSNLAGQDNGQPTK